MHISNFTRLSNGYFWYFAVLGLAMPFLAVWLEGRGFSSQSMGEMLAIFTATKIVGPTFWAFFADKSGRQLSVIRAGASLSLIFFIGLFFVDGYWPITLFLAAFSLFWTGVLPQYEVLTLNSFRNNPKIYARIRLWGSIGFIALAVIGGEVIASLGSESFLTLGLAVLFGLWLSTLSMKEREGGRKARNEVKGMSERIFNLPFVYFFLAGLLLQISFGPYYSFFALYVRDLGYPSYAVGALIGVSVVAEVLIFVLMGRVFKRFSVFQVLTFSIAITGIRWLISAKLGQVLPLLIIAQVMHAASYALYHSASMQFIQSHFKFGQHNRGQAIYISGVYGVGGALGAYIAGLLWQDGAGIELSYIAAGVCALTGAFFAGLLMVAKK
ncbi:MFS transporter [Thalassotalea euphylliae]|uniref:MFS transporter n=1 Tax=Thalassotalea euphylliae TaxID=1655234 RepID=UPI00363C6059